MIKCSINDVNLKLFTDSKLFSPNHIDIGTLTMLSKIKLHPEMKILDLGCGYGVIGIYAAHFCGASNVTMVDINPIAVKITKKNIIYNEMKEISVFQSDGFNNIKEKEFDIIFSNPPYHADFSVPKHFIEDAFYHLKYGGKLIMATKRYKWYKNKLIAIFGGVTIKHENGYYIFIAEKRLSHKNTNKRQPKLSKKLHRKYNSPY